MRRIRLTLTLLAAAACGCSTKPTVETQRQIGDLAPGTFEVAWSADPQTRAAEAFYLTGDLLFIYDKNNQVSAYDLSGGLQFRAIVGQPGDLVGQPIVQPDRILFPTTGTVELWTRTGVRTKTIVLPKPVRSPGVAVGNTMFFGADSEQGGRIAAIELDRTYNYERWTALLNGILSTKPALFDNVLYCPTQNGVVYAINQDRTPLWPVGPEMPDGLFHTDGKIIAAIKADDGGVFVPSTDTKLYCLNPINGRVRWTYYAGAPLTTSPVVTTDTVYQFVDGEGIVALPKKSADANAKPKWTFADGVQVVADDAKYAYVHTSRNSIVAVDKATGTMAFSTKRNDIVQVVVSSDPKNAAVYALTRGGRLVCIRPVLKTGVVGELAMLTTR